jgi:biotin carboxyl carrier protein
MKRLKITVDGTAYDVTVEEVGGAAPVPAAAPAAAPVSAPVAAAAPAAAPAPAAAAPAPKGTGAAGEVHSPLAGTVLKIEVAVGQEVATGDPVLVLEAMKMESVISAPTSGSVKSIDVAAGSSVQEGQLLLTIG